VTRSRRVLLVMTPEYFGSDWTAFENVMGADAGPRGSRAAAHPHPPGGMQAPPAPEHAGPHRLHAARG
jgi:hypothetical protein